MAKAELREVFADRTVVVVANRVSSVRECDQIVVIDQGRIVERGTDAELILQGGLYARLAREQQETEQAGTPSPLSGANGANGANGGASGSEPRS